MINSNKNKQGKNYVPKSKFERGGSSLYDSAFGEIIPFFNKILMPGERVKITQNDFTRTQPLVVPPFGHFKEEVRWFKVSLRALYSDFEKMYMAENHNTDTYQIPHIAFANITEFLDFYKKFGYLFYHFGMPQNWAAAGGTETTLWYPPKVSLLHIRAYIRIYFEHFHDHSKYAITDYQDLKAKMIFENGGAFTYAQFLDKEGRYLRNLAIGSDVGAHPWQSASGKAKRGFFEIQHTGDYFSKISLTIQKTATSVGQGSSLEDLKKGFNLKSWLDNLIKTRRDYTNYSKKVFGVNPPSKDEYSEYIWGNSSQLAFSEVTATTQDLETGQALGDIAAKGYAHPSTSFTYEANEFCMIMGMRYAYMEPMYFGGFDQSLFMLDTMDFPHLEFQSNYYEDIKKFHTNNSLDANNSDVIGFMPPYNSFRFGTNRVGGRFSGDMSIWCPVLDKVQGVTQVSIGSLYDSVLLSGIQANRWAYLIPLQAIDDLPLFYNYSSVRVESSSPLSHVQQQLNMF